MKKGEFPKAIKHTLYVALFGTKMKSGLETTNLPTKTVEQLKTEETTGSHSSFTI